ncbi:MAG: TIGR00297 family protein [Geminocystis sp.]|nr:TIGR00297 family protein [Geminocystis sp.]MCS7147104.1 TIGR00297 family protein [Geminocystis sp.]MCX8079147.1 TIGR00297 family protein [Geminocystis sp.]MDW8116740.1 TIGR00297 family protein [Geminocystis sp.]HIK36975.1 TIGR00297 family protein [Geminocystis sp. M7585_C2015_104]
MEIVALILSNSWLTAVVVNTLLLLLALILPQKLLTVFGYLNAWALGVVIWGCLQWRGYVIVLFYFILGSAITKLGLEEKIAAGIAEKRGGKRGAENVWGSAFVAFLCALASVFFPQAKSLFLLAYTASFATKFSDTCASEFGKVYGSRTFLITTFQPVPKGTEGAISLEGTIAGIVASVAISLLGWFVNLIDATGVVICVVSAFVATSIESIIGATFQQKFYWLTNEIVNVINTLVGSVCAILLLYVYQSFSFFYHFLLSVQMVE